MRHHPNPSPITWSQFSNRSNTMDDIIDKASALAPYIIYFSKRTVDDVFELIQKFQKTEMGRPLSRKTLSCVDNMPEEALKTIFIEVFLFYLYLVDTSISQILETEKRETFLAVIMSAYCESVLGSSAASNDIKQFMSFHLDQYNLRLSEYQGYKPTPAKDEGFKNTLYWEFARKVFMSFGPGADGLMILAPPLIAFVVLYNKLFNVSELVAGRRHESRDNDSIDVSYYEIEKVKLYVAALQKPLQKSLQWEHDKMLRVTPHDYVRNIPTGDLYFVSTVVTGKVGHQTGIFIPKGLMWLWRPMLRICLDNKGDPTLHDLNACSALTNHIISLILVAEEHPSTWPKGICLGEPKDPVWRKCKHLVPGGHLTDIYLGIREKYDCSLRRR